MLSPISLHPLGEITSQCELPDVTQPQENELWSTFTVHLDGFVDPQQLHCDMLSQPTSGQPCVQYDLNLMFEASVPSTPQHGSSGDACSALHSLNSNDIFSQSCNGMPTVRCSSETEASISGALPDRPLESDILVDELDPIFEDFIQMPEERDGDLSLLESSRHTTGAVFVVNDIGSVAKEADISIEADVIQSSFDSSDRAREEAQYSNAQLPHGFNNQKQCSSQMNLGHVLKPSRYNRKRGSRRPTRLSQKSSTTKAESHMTSPQMELRKSSKVHRRRTHLVKTISRSLKDCAKISPNEIPKQSSQHIPRQVLSDSELDEIISVPSPKRQAHLTAKSQISDQLKVVAILKTLTSSEGHSLGRRPELLLNSCQFRFENSTDLQWDRKQNGWMDSASDIDHNVAREYVKMFLEPHGDDVDVFITNLCVLVEGENVSLEWSLEEDCWVVSVLGRVSRLAREDVAYSIRELVSESILGE